MKVNNEIVKQELDINSEGTAITFKREVTPAVWHMITEVAMSVHKSHIFPWITSPESAAIVMLKGYEVGFSLMASFEFIQPIKGKYEVSPRGALALMHQSPTIESVKVAEEYDADGESYVGASCTIKRASGFEFTGRFTLENADRAGLIKPDSGYDKYPENMCRWRAIGFAADVAAPDITSGMTSIMKMPEEYGVSIDDTGRIVEAEASMVKNVNVLAEQKSTPVDEKPKAVNILTLEQLADKYGAEAIMVANEGKIPASPGELEEVQTKLEAANVS